MELREEWKKILEASYSIYIYGAGKIGKRIYNLIEKENQLAKLQGFVVSELKGGITNIENKPVIEINKLNKQDSTIFVSVSDMYQNEIMELLQHLEYKHVICVYKYSFLDEKEVPQDMPESIMIDLRELLIQQYNGLDFNRYDTLVRLLAIEAYYGKNDYGFELYAKMANARIYEGYADIAIRRFKELIHSFEEHGYDEQSEIIVDRNLKLVDGSHRLALAIYYNISKVRIRILNRFEDIHYGLDFFQKYFDESQCAILEQCYKKISMNWVYH